MAVILRLRNRYFFFLDVVLLMVASVLAYALRLDAFNFDQVGYGFLCFTLYAVMIVPTVFWLLGIYSRYWVYASVDELLWLSGAVTLGVAVSGALSWITAWISPGVNIPRSIPFIFLPLALAATGVPRFGVRYYAQHMRRHPRMSPAPVTHQRVLVAGAGHAGMLIVREVLNNPALGMDVVGFVDDDLSKRSARIMGVPVLGDRRAISALSKEYAIELVIIAMPTAPGREIRDIVTICEQAGVSTKIMPGLYEMIGGAVSVNQLRNVQIEDLLRREPITTDVDAVKLLLARKRVLVTGGGGSIGSELCRQILRCGPAELIVLGHGENSVFEICAELNRTLHSLARSTVTALDPLPIIHSTIADVRFPERLQAVFEQYRPEIVFHAAAHKHVPLMEENPTEAISNNVLGTRNLLDVAVMLGVERFVMISTDKAVRPKSIMGASKRVAEMLVHQTAWEVGKPFVAVRFGNVLGSRGSVLHTFRRQIAAGGPVTVTHPDMKRYFMTIPEAVQLVLQAAVLGQGGEIFMLDMGEPVKIVDLARDVIELSGLEVGRDIEIQFSGIRPGEKLHEELFTPGESYRRTEHQKVFVIESAANAVLPSQLNQMIARLEEAVYDHQVDQIRLVLQELLPDANSPDAVVTVPDQPTGSLPVELSASEEQPAKLTRG